MLTLKILSFDPESSDEPDLCMYQVLYTGHDGAQKQYGITERLMRGVWLIGERPTEFDQYPGFIEMLQVIYCAVGDGGKPGCMVGQEVELRSASPD